MGCEKDDAALAAEDVDDIEDAGATEEMVPATSSLYRSPDELDALARAHIPVSLLKKERALYDTKWFDYRFWEPTLATLHFTQAYRDAHCHVMRYRYDDYRGQFMPGIQKRDYFDLKPAVITALWKARQTADTHGIQYDFFCLTAMQLAESSNWSRLPRPSQLYDKEIVAELNVRWLDSQRFALRLAKDPFYKASLYRDHAYQQQYQQYLISQTQTRANPIYSLYTLLVVDKSLKREVAEQHYPSSLVSKAISLDLIVTQ